MRLQGVYAGGLQHANALVKAGHVAVHRFKLMAGYMGWEPGQLRREVCSQDTLLAVLDLLCLLANCCLLMLSGSCQGCLSPWGCLKPGMGFG